MFAWFDCSHCPSPHKTQKSPYYWKLPNRINSELVQNVLEIKMPTCRTLSIPFVKFTNFDSSPGGAIFVWYKRCCASPVIEGMNCLLKAVSWIATSMSESNTSSRVEILFVVDCNNATIFAVYDETTKNKQIKAKNYWHKIGRPNEKKWSDSMNCWRKERTK